MSKASSDIFSYGSDRLGRRATAPAYHPPRRQRRRSARHGAREISSVRTRQFTSDSPIPALHRQGTALKDRRVVICRIYHLRVRPGSLEYSITRLMKNVETKILRLADAIKTAKQQNKIIREAVASGTLERQNLQHAAQKLEKLKTKRRKYLEVFERLLQSLLKIQEIKGNIAQRI